MTKSVDDITKLLSDPFEAHDIEWLVTNKTIAKDGSIWVTVSPYITARAVQQRLDDIFGLTGWENEFREVRGGQMCGLTLKIGDQRITKWDGAAPTEIESFKGSLSSATKRAAVQFGIGRYLYAIEPYVIQCQLLTDKAECTANYVVVRHDTSETESTYLPAQWETPELPSWALPQANFKPYIEKIQIADTETELSKAYTSAIRFADALGRQDLKDQVNAARKTRLTDIKAEEDQKKKEGLENLRFKFKKFTQRLEGAENETILNKIFKEVSSELRGLCMSEGQNAEEYANKLNQIKQQQITRIQGA